MLCTRRICKFRIKTSWKRTIGSRVAQKSHCVTWHRWSHFRTLLSNLRLNLEKKDIRNWLVTSNKIFGDSFVTEIKINVIKSRWSIRQDFYWIFSRSLDVFLQTIVAFGFSEDIYFGLLFIVKLQFLYLVCLFV